MENNMFRCSDILLALAICLSCSYGKEMTEIEALGAQPTHCTYEYAYDMYGAHCAGLRLNKIPKLKGGIEILDFSDNKLHELHADTLSSISGVRFLYLTENQIYQIDEDAFTPLTYLETLDLSNNVILQVPNSLFQLPSLRKLYLRGNPILHKNPNEFIISTPIRAPLELLDISDCKIRELPNWGTLPQLMSYNISRNPLISLDTGHFAQMCNLIKVDLTESDEDIKLCDMRSTILWFQAKRVAFQVKDYSKFNTKEFESCPGANITDMLIYNSTYHTCRADYSQVQSIRTSRRTWLTIGGGLAGFLIGFILLLYIMHRHNVARTKTAAEKMKQATPRDSDKNATATLLNNIS